MHQAKEATTNKLGPITTGLVHGVIALAWEGRYSGDLFRMGILFVCGVVLGCTQYFVEKLTPSPYIPKGVGVFVATVLYLWLCSTLTMEFVPQSLIMSTVAGIAFVYGLFELLCTKRSTLGITKAIKALISSVSIGCGAFLATMLMGFSFNF